MVVQYSYVLLREYYPPNDHVDELAYEDVLEQYPNPIDQSMVVVLSARRNQNKIIIKKKIIRANR